MFDVHDMQVLKSTPNFAGMLHPFIANTELSKFGIPIGIEIHTRKLVFLDPWELKDAGIINGTVVLVTGSRGNGKSVILKTLPLNLMGWQAGQREQEVGEELIVYPEFMRSRFDDLKPEGDEGEYTGVARFLECPTIKLNEISINIIDPKMKMSDWDVYDTAVGVCEFANNRQPLDEAQLQALRVGVWKMQQRIKRLASIPNLLKIERGLTLDDLTAYNRAGDNELRHMNLQNVERMLDDTDDDREQAELREQWQNLEAIMREPDIITEEEFRAGTRKTSQHLDELLRGRFGRFIGGTSSLREALELPAGVFDWRGLTDEVVTLISAMRKKWEKGALDRNDLDIIAHIAAGDEVHQAYSDPMHVRFESELFRTARARHTFHLRSTQYEPDLTMAGAPDSQHRRLAEGIRNSFGFRIIGGHPRTPANIQMLMDLGLSQEDAITVCEQDVGEFCILVPDRPPIFIQYLLTPAEYELVKSDSATRRMMERIPVTEFDETVERAVRHGIIKDSVIQVGHNENGHGREVE